MNAPAPLRMSPDAYLAWEARQERKHELVDGVVRLMAGGTTRHFDIRDNIVRHLWPLLRGGSCKARGEGVKVFTPRGNYRYPDALIECGAPKPTDHVADRPTVLFEVDSPNTTTIEEMDRIEDYKSIESVRCVVLVAQAKAQVRVWTREGDGWRVDTVEGLEGPVALAPVDLALPMAAIYEDVTFDDL